MDEDGDEDIYASGPQRRVQSPKTQQQQSTHLKSASASEEVDDANSEEDEDGEEDESDSVWTASRVNICPFIY